MERRKIAFRLVQDGDGYPPASVETVWARASGDEMEYVIENVPFFSRDATLGDQVRVVDDGAFLWFDKVTRASGNSLVRIVFFSSDDLPVVRTKLEEFGCETEFSRNFGILAVNVPSDSSLSLVRTFLEVKAKQGMLDYEEAITGGIRNSGGSALAAGDN